MNILIVDDEKEIVELIELYLSKEPYQCFKAYNGIEAINLIQKEAIDLAIVDIMMPDISGFTVVKRIRETLKIPIIILSARDEFSDKILGLDIGADDYMTKPFNGLELVARVQAQLRRVHKYIEKTSDQVSSQYSFGDILLDTEKCLVSKSGQEILLTTTEYKILVLLAEGKGKVFTKQQIFDHIWDMGYVGDENTLRVHMSNLREKLETDPKNPTHLKTIRGLGYKLEASN